MNERSNNKLAEEAIIPNLSHYLRNNFELAYCTVNSMQRICRTLTLIANKHKRKFDTTDKGKEGQICRNYNNDNRSFTNKCKIHGVDEWKDCRREI